jgi:hypothetical protein
METLEIIGKIENLPEDIKKEVYDFIEFKTKKAHEIEPIRKPTLGSGKGFFNLQPGWDDPLKDVFKDYI